MPALKALNGSLEGINRNTAASIAMTASRFSSNMPLGAEQQVWAWVYHACSDARGYETVRDRFAYIRHLPNKRFAQSNSNVRAPRQAINVSRYDLTGDTQCL